MTLKITVLFCLFLSFGATVFPQKEVKKAPNAQFVAINASTLKIDPSIIDKYVYAESVFEQEDNAVRRVKEFLDKGFKDAFYIYLPDYSTRIDDEKKLFAVIPIMSNYFNDELEKEILEFIEDAESKGIELISEDRILWVNPK